MFARARRLLHAHEVADRHQFRDLLGGTAEIDVNVLDSVRAVLVVLHVGRDRADNPGEIPALGVDRRALSPQDVGVPTAQGVDREKALLGHVLDHEADLVHVGRGRDLVVAGSLDGADDVAHRVGRYRVDGLGELPADELANAVLVAGDAAGLGQFPQQVEVEVRVGRCSTPFHNPPQSGGAR